MATSSNPGSIGAWFMQRVLLPLHHFWLWLREWLSVLKPCRFSILMVLVGIAFLILAQGQDVLRALAERQDGHADEWQQFFFFTSMLAWSLYAWYLARVMLYLEFPGVPGNKRRYQAFRAWVPRIIGLIATFGVAVALYRASLGYESAEYAAVRSLLRGWAIWFVIGGLAFFAVVSARRAMSRAAYAKLKRVAALQGPLAAPMVKLLDVRRSDKEVYGALDFADLPRSTRVLMLLSLLGVLVLFLLFVFALQPSAPLIGPAGILLLAAAGWIAAGSVFDFIGMRLRFPLLTALFLLALVFSLWNDNHAVRVLAERPAAWENRADLRAALKDWFNHQLLRPVGAKGEYPLFVVSGEGGGIRAAYWTATVLSEIQKQNPCFADQLFSLSGVSGGSLGSAVFTALLAEQNATRGAFRCDREGGAIDGKKLQEQAQAILGEDFLSPVMAAALYPDLTQRVLPFPVPSFDRARALEQAWERAWRQHVPGSNRFAEPFDRLWQDRNAVWMPALFLNSTWVETGKRLIVSNLRLAPRDATDAEDFVDMEDAHRFFGEHALSLSSAVHLSARFTYVSPAGTLTKDDGTVYGRAVDGGYFENSGATTTLEILKTINLLAKLDPRWKQVRPVVIHISNEPVRKGKDGKDKLASKDKSSQAKPLAGLNEILSPLIALLNTRDARAVYARETVQLHVGDADFLHFGLCQNKNQVSIPLGWVLSDVVQGRMQEQLAEGDCVPAFDNIQNLRVIGERMAARRR